MTSQQNVVLSDDVTLALSDVTAEHRVQCDPGSVPDATDATYCGSYVCTLLRMLTFESLGDVSSVLVECAPGSFCSREQDACLPCEVGYFQPESGRAACRRCVGGWTTRGRGARFASECCKFCVHALCSSSSIVCLFTGLIVNL